MLVLALVLVPSTALAASWQLVDTAPSAVHIPGWQNVDTAAPEVVSKVRNWQMIDEAAPTVISKVNATQITITLPSMAIDGMISMADGTYQVNTLGTDSECGLNGTWVHRIYLSFDAADLSLIPEGATIVSVELHVYMHPTSQSHVGTYFQEASWGESLTSDDWDSGSRIRAYVASPTILDRWTIIKIFESAVGDWNGDTVQFELSSINETMSGSLGLYLNESAHSPYIIVTYEVPEITGTWHQVDAAAPELSVHAPEWQMVNEASGVGHVPIWNDIDAASGHAILRAWQLVETVIGAWHVVPIPYSTELLGTISLVLGLLGLFGAIFILPITVALYRRDMIGGMLDAIMIVCIIGGACVFLVWISFFVL